MTFNYLMFLWCFVMCMKMINAKYELTLENIEMAFGEKDQLGAFEGLRVKKFNRTSYVLNGKYNLKILLDDNIDVLFEGFNLQGGQYKKIFEKRFDKFCKSLYIDTFKEPFADFYAASSIKFPFGTCPYPAGRNEVTNLMFSDNGMLPPYIPGGEKWRINFRFIKNNVVLGGLNMYGLIRNERSLLKGG